MALMDYFIVQLLFIIVFFCIVFCPIFLWYAVNINIPFVVDGHAKENQSQSFAESAMFLSLEND